MAPEACISFIIYFLLFWNAFKVYYSLFVLTYYILNNLLFIVTFLTLTHNLTKQWQCNIYFNVIIAIVLVTSQKRNWMVSEITGELKGVLWWARSEIIAREGQLKYNIALCSQPIKMLDFHQNVITIYIIYVYI